MIRFLFARMQDELNRPDVTVIGGGMAGMAASIHLARAGYRVLCLEPDPDSNKVVGESLDWSAPPFLEVLGLSMERLIGEKIATYKRHVTLNLNDATNRHYVPGEWLGRPPYNVELRTLHVDRLQLDAVIRRIVLSEGVQLVVDRAVEVETEGRTVTAVRTAAGRRIASRWYLDATGSGTSLFARAFHLRVDEYGPRKAAMWGYLPVPESVEGTTLYMDGQPPYMEWIWEIPIHSNQISVGYVAAGDAIKAKRQQGLSVQDIFLQRLERIPRFEKLLHDAGEISPHVTSFQCRVYRGITGPNWLIIGEAAALVDPMTSNGVTAALRHAAEAAALIIQSGHRRQLPRLGRALYRRRVADLARFFNCGIERVIYDPAIRARIGVLTAGDVYTIPAWSLNAVYSRLRPEGAISTLLFGLVLSLFRAGSTVFYALCRWLEGTRKAGG